MKNIRVTDITLCVSAEDRREQLSFREKLHIAQSLDAVGVDCIELGRIGDSKEGKIIVRTIAASLKNSTAAVIAGESAESIAQAWEYIKEAKNPCLQIVLPVSTVQMEYLYHVKASKMQEMLASLVSEAVKYTKNVEVVLRDATRAEDGFVATCCKVAEERGAAAVTVCDDSGVYFPEDYATLIAEIRAVCALPLYVQPSDALKMAAASAVAALRAGADGVKGTVNGGAYLDIGDFADVYRAKSEALQICCKLDTTAIHKKLASVSIANKAKDAEADAALTDTAAESGVLDENCTSADVIAAVKELGYELSDEDNGKVYEEFRRLIEKKKTIGAPELEAIIATAAMQVPSTYHLINYVVNSGNIITATANVTLERNGETLTGVSIGDGPIDAAFHAIEQILGHHYELDDFRVQAITKGREAVGSSLIRLRANGKLYSGNGVSTDIIGACIRAYMNALNKIVYEEN